MTGKKLREAAAHGDAAYLAELLSGGANPCSRDENGVCALHLACWNGHRRCAEYLAVNDLGPSGSKDGTKMSCLHLQSSVGWTPLHILAVGTSAMLSNLERQEFVRFLLLVGIDPTKRDETGLTALQIAEERENYVVAEILKRPRPSLDERRANMAALSATKQLVHYKERPPRPLEMRIPSDLDFDQPYQPLLDTSFQSKKKIEASGPEHDARRMAKAYVLDQTKDLRLPPLPRDFVIPEGLILPFAQSNYKHNLNIPALHNLMFALNEASRHAERRKKLTDIQYKEQSKTLHTHATPPENSFIYRKKDDEACLRAAGLLPFYTSSSQIYKPHFFSSSSSTSASATLLSSSSPTKPNTFTSAALPAKTTTTATVAAS